MKDQPNSLPLREVVFFPPGDEEFCLLKYHFFSNNLKTKKPNMLIPFEVSAYFTESEGCLQLDISVICVCTKLFADFFFLSLNSKGYELFDQKTIESKNGNQN